VARVKYRRRNRHKAQNLSLTCATLALQHGKTALIEASDYGRMKVIEMLVNGGADLNLMTDVRV
jgi:ankyrin repeat protein